MSKRTPPLAPNIHQQFNYLHPCSGALTSPLGSALGTLTISIVITTLVGNKRGGRLKTVGSELWLRDQKSRFKQRARVISSCSVWHAPGATGQTRFRKNIHPSRANNSETRHKLRSALRITPSKLTSASVKHAVHVGCRCLPSFFLPVFLSFRRFPGTRRGRGGGREREWRENERLQGSSIVGAKLMHVWRKKRRSFFFYNERGFYFVSSKK